MKYLSFDESGDLGLNIETEGVSRIFSVTFLIASDNKTAANIIKRTLRHLMQNGKKRKCGTLHAHFEDKPTRYRVLKRLSARDIQVATMRLDKSKIIVSETPHALYSSMVVSLVNRLYNDGILDKDEPVELTASQMHSNKHRNKEFLNVVETRTATAKFTMRILRPENEKSLQAVDFLSWALWRKYEHGDTEYSDLIPNIVIREYEYY
ncbi:MAG: DUF3800 domain-containing protein [Clostridiales Family XIII bacterium]|jgi:hypothetical protein|nr:DUF3800 domain-containing protein [Clostridiales Family XIII bacterium]